MSTSIRAEYLANLNVDFKIQRLILNFEYFMRGKIPHSSTLKVKSPPYRNYVHPPLGEIFCFIYKRAHTRYINFGDNLQHTDLLWTPPNSIVRIKLFKAKQPAEILLTDINKYNKAWSFLEQNFDIIELEPSVSLAAFNELNRQPSYNSNSNELEADIVNTPLQLIKNLLDHKYKRSQISRYIQIKKSVLAEYIKKIKTGHGALRSVGRPLSFTNERLDLLNQILSNSEFKITTLRDIKTLVVASDPSVDRISIGTFRSAITKLEYVKKRESYLHQIVILTKLLL